MRDQPEAERARTDREIDREIEEQTASPLPPRMAMSVIDPSLVKLPIAKLVLPGDVASVPDPTPTDES
jgi:hypothetical protein